MFIEFSFGNFRSFKAKVTLSAVAANIKARDQHLNENNTFDANGKLRLLTSLGIYGANASGKSNLVAAFDFMRDFILESLTELRAGQPIPVQPFMLSTETEAAPSFFEIVFLIEGVQYRYGFELDREGIVAEWLFHIPRTREALLFSREGDSYDIRRGFSEGKGLEEKTRSNTLFLPVVAQFNGKKAAQVLRWFARANVISGLQDTGYMPFSIKQIIEGPYKKHIIDLVKRLDLGIEDIIGRKVEPGKMDFPSNMPDALKEAFLGLVEKGGELLTADTRHKKYDTNQMPVGLVTFDMDHYESEGTKKLFALGGPLIDTLEKGQVLFVDELEARLHPLMVQKLVNLFNDKSTNPHHAQLIFTTHDTNLLSNKLLRRDQIWFVEKNRYGASDLYSLAELKIRNDASFESDYIKGKYGAIPYLGGIKQLTLEAE